MSRSSSRRTIQCCSALLLLALLLPLSAVMAAERPMLTLSFDTLDAAQCKAGTLVKGVSERALQFTVATDYVPVDLGKQLNAQFTLSVWANPSEYPDASGQSFTQDAPITLATLNGTDKKPSAVFRITLGKLEFAFFDGKEWIELTGTSRLEIGQWYYTSVVRNGTALSIFVNGKMEATVPVQCPIPVTQVVPGRWGGNRKFLGLLDELCIYDRALGAEVLTQIMAEQNRTQVDTSRQLEASPRQNRFGKYPTLRVGEDVVHPFISALYMSTIPVPWSAADRFDLLSAANVSQFGTRTALHRALPDNAGQIPIYDEGQTLEDLPGLRHQLILRNDGLFDLVAESDYTPYGTNMLVYLKNVGKVGQPHFADAMPLYINRTDLRGAIEGKATGWYVGDVDDDTVPDLLVQQIAYDAPANPDGSFWNGKEKTNQGKGRGYDIAGHWLGNQGTSKLMWARGQIDTQGQLSFDVPKIVHYRHYGFALQWKAAAGDRATCAMQLQGQTYVVMSGDTDAMMAAPVHMVDGELFADDAVNLLADDARLKYTYYPFKLTPCDIDGDGQQEIVVDGNPARVTVLKGTDVGQFVETASIQMKGGAVAVDTLANPCREDWDGDGKLDLIVGDSSGYLTFWPGTSDPMIYGTPVFMRSAGQIIQIQAGDSGSIQGPTERRWGYLNPTVGDWDDDGKTEIISNDINSHLCLYRRTGDPHELQAPIRFTLDGKPYVPAWRNRPAILARAINFNNANLPAILHLDWDGDLAVAVPNSLGSTELARIEKLKYKDGNAIRLCGPDGLWGRTKLAVADWDGDGDWDVVFGSNSTLQEYYLSPDNNPGRGSATPCLLENMGSASNPVFASTRPIRLSDNTYISLGGHNASAMPTDLDGDGQLDLVVGAEDGKVYRFLRSELSW
ncbi:MAG: hypothetical protein IT445_15085 [Phycisphaeraceae bacterium]|nr:hypothetical protein [Phycisphaeraceae bacterium]